MNMGRQIPEIAKLKLKQTAVYAQGLLWLLSAVAGTTPPQPVAARYSRRQSGHHASMRRVCEFFSRSTGAGCLRVRREILMWMRRMAR